MGKTEGKEKKTKVGINKWDKNRIEKKQVELK